MTDSKTTFTSSFGASITELLDTLRSGNYPYLHLADSKGVIGDKTLLAAAHRNSELKRYVIALTKVGYHVYHVVDGVARFVREDHIPKMWHSVRDGNYQVSDEGLIYKLEEPVAGGPTNNLVVIFSSIGGDIFGNGLSRYFTMNFKSIQKHLPADTAILRIADIGGAVGSFYLDTQSAPHNSKRVTNLIEAVRHERHLGKESVITYGASKGATGALYQALTNGYRCVCVEPIVNDAYYETAFGDTHFTRDGVFLKSKEEFFNEAMEQHERTIVHTSAFASSSIVVVYSDQSPQAPYIRETLGGHNTAAVSLVNFRHPSISDHPDVSPNSLNLISMYLNMMCYRFPFGGGHFGLSCMTP